MSASEPSPHRKSRAGAQQRAQPRSKPAATIPRQKETMDDGEKGKRAAGGRNVGMQRREARLEEKNHNLRSADKRERPKSYRAKAEESCVCWKRTAWDGMTGVVFSPCRLAVKGRGYRRDGDGRRRNGKSMVGWVAAEEDDCCLSNRARAGLFDGEGSRLQDCHTRVDATAEGPGRESRRHGGFGVGAGKEESRWFGEADTCAVGFR